MPIDGHVDYFGVLTQVIEVEYFDKIRVMLFRCDWVDPSMGVHKDEMGFTTVNFKHLLYSGQCKLDEPFVFPSQTEQVFYVEDDLSPNWHVVIRSKIRDIYDIGEQNNGVQEQALIQSNLNQSTQPLHPLDDCEGDDDVKWIRTDLTGVVVDTPNGGESSDGNTFKHLYMCFFTHFECYSLCFFVTFKILLYVFDCITYQTAE